MKTTFTRLFSLMTVLLLFSCDQEENPCNGKTDLTFEDLKGEVRYDNRFNRNVIIVMLHTPGDGRDVYVPCSLPDEFQAGDNVIFSGEGTKVEGIPIPDVLGGESFYYLVLSSVELQQDDL
ncbi:MAG: hypothetical protein KIT62_07470 [Cyclobacteriaceae bacterium]|nr:hypothetical protein [Cyclobacteriaceae bacterium]